MEPPFPQLQRYDHKWFRSPFGIVHAADCRWCFSRCDGWVGVKQLQKAVENPRLQPCVECHPYPRNPKPTCRKQRMKF